MTDEDIAKLLSRLTESLAKKEDVSNVREDIEKLEVNLGYKIDELNNKADTILEFAEAVDETVVDNEKRLKRIEAIPVIAHQIQK